MDYDLVKPCNNCPFRKVGGVRLRPSRAHEICTTQGEFPCHKTTVVDEDPETGEEDLVADEKSKHCAGFLIYREKTETTSQLMRIAERFGDYDPASLMADEETVAAIIDNPDEMVEIIAAHNSRRKKL